MQHRKLGKTGLDVSVIGLGGGMLGSSETDYAVRVIKRATDLGIDYFDTAHSYPDSEVRLGHALKQRRKEVYISSKTGATTKGEAWCDINESLRRLETNYLDNYHLHGLREGKDLETRLGQGGALEALVEARERGLIRHIGCTSHRSQTLIKALQHFDFEIILVPMNIVEREPLKELLPLCERKGVGVTIMKPVATGLLPARLALKWLLNQDIDTAVPGAATIEEIQTDAEVGQLRKLSINADEERRIERLEQMLQNRRCRICAECEPCPKGIPIASTLGTDVMYDHYRTMGPQAFSRFAWSTERVKQDIQKRNTTISAIRSCNLCGECERKCPYELPIVKMLRDTVEPMEEMFRIWHDELGT